MFKLLIGNRRFSSWSLRAWLLARQLGISLETELLPYTRPDWGDLVRSNNAAGTVPVLVADGHAVGDSLAIAETLAELFPQAGVWPAQRWQRAQARSLCAEMHGSFQALREECAFDALRDGAPRPLSAPAAAQLRRAEAIFAAAEAGGGWLCGAFCAADAFYAPLALRVLQYGLEVSPPARAYVDRIAALPAVREWLVQAEAERGWPAQIPGGRPYHRAIISGGDALALARRWTAAWNARDLDAVLEMFVEDAVFVSPKAELLVGLARVAGKEALRRYWSLALERIPRIAFKLETADWDAAAAVLTVVYEAELAGRKARAVERWLLDPDGRIRYGEAYYGASA